MTSADLQNASAVGQALTGIAVVLTGLSVLGLIKTIRLQTQELHDNRAVAVRNLHVDLMQMVVQDADLATTLGSLEQRRGKKRKVYLNLLVSYWQMLFQLGEMSDRQVEVSADDLFESLDARNFWRGVRDVRSEYEESDTDRRFFGLIDESWARAGSETRRSIEPREAGSSWWPPAASSAMVGVVFFVMWRLARRQERDSRTGN